MPDNEIAERAARILVEQAVGAADAVALVFHVLEAKGILQHQDVAEAIRAATDMIPDEYAAEPRYRVMVSLRTLLDDPAMRHTLPFPWGQS